MGTEPNLIAPIDGRQSEAARDIARGCCRKLAQYRVACLPELPLANGLRADLVGLADSGDIIIVEIKSCLADFRADNKWAGYRDFCDRLYFAVAPAFPRDVLPPDAGLIIADRFSAEIMREAPEHRLAAARRKAVTLRFGRAAAARLHGICDPQATLEL